VTRYLRYVRFRQSEALLEILILTANRILEALSSRIAIVARDRSTATTRTPKTPINQALLCE
jgi:hypothetical protein